MANHQQSYRQNEKSQRPGGGQPSNPQTGALAERAKDAATALGDRASEAATAVGSGMESLAGTIRERGPREGMWGSASDQVARTLETGGRYLKEEGLSGMLDDVAVMVRKNPIPAILVGIGVGFLLARTTSRS
jgi:hypothetical protein